MTQPRLTVITPTRNYGRFLPGCLESVAHQGRADVEHVVVDGASTDHTLEILKAWEGPGRRWLSEPDRNQSDALNKGLAMAGTEWVCWLNADEFYLPGALDAVFAVIDAGLSDVVSGDFVEVDEGGRLGRVLPQHAFSQRVLDWYGPYLPSCGTFFRRVCVPEGGFDLSLRFVMDWDLWLAMTHAGARVIHLPRPLAAFTLHDASLTGQGLDRMHPELQSLRRRHGLPYGRATAPMWWAARAERVLRKGLNGSYGRLRGWSGLVGEDLRWFDDSVGPAAWDLVR
jgi:glycosyltransferase involved in cell wall biosynthesis